MTELSTRLEDRLARVQSPRNDALQASHLLFPDGEQRFNDRQASALAAFVSFKGYATPVACEIVDRSANGARIKLLNDRERLNLDANDLPERVTIRLTDSNNGVECQVRWRMGAEFGIRLMPTNFSEKQEPQAAADAG